MMSGFKIAWRVLSSVCAFLLLASSAFASPSSVFWTVCTTHVYPAGVGHFDEDVYFTVFNRRGHGSYLPPDTGLELGLSSYCGIGAEAGIDYLGGANDPLYFNAKVAVPEGWFYCNAPSCSVGMFNVGTRTQSPANTNQNVVDLIFGKTLPEWMGGTLFWGGFAGGKALGKDRYGIMVAYQQRFCPALYCDQTEYHKWILSADWASGKNTIGGGGVALGYYFTPDISILSGPIWFNTAEYNGRWKWSVQLLIDFLVFDPCCF